MAKVSANYEVVYIVDPALGEEGIAAMVAKFKTLAEQHSSAVEVEEWGSRKLAWKLGFHFDGQLRGGYNDRGTPGDRWVLSLAAGEPQAPQEPWTGPAPVNR